jgi:uncharacterized protein YjiS (DUF1127 family)
MATITLNQKTASRRSGGRVAHLFASLAEWNRERLRRKNVAGELFAMSELELRDLGISQADFPAIVDGTFRR